MINKLMTLLISLHFLQVTLQAGLGLKKKHTNLTVNNNLQLRNLLSYLCSNIGDVDDTALKLDCNNCFRDAIRANDNQPSSSELRDCAFVYLTDTLYEICIQALDEATTNGAIATGYCPFVRCVRRVNSNLLISQCYDEASAINDLITMDDQVIFYENVTSCILAKSRCSEVNPVTGQPQNNTFNVVRYNKWKKRTVTSTTLYNSLQITPSGDLRVIGLPSTTTIQTYFCPAGANLRQASWLDYSC